MSPGKSRFKMYTKRYYFFLADDLAVVDFFEVLLQQEDFDAVFFDVVFAVVFSAAFAAVAFFAVAIYNLLCFLSTQNIVALFSKYHNI